MNILLIEDEPKTAWSLKHGLEEKNFLVDLAYDGLTGKRLAMNKAYDLIISDIILPHINGLELCNTLRANGIQTPLLMLTALGTTEDKVHGFDSGADDYLVKPFAFDELLARIRSLLRRGQGAVTPSRILKFSDLELNLDTKTAFREGKEIVLTAREFALIEYFMKNKGIVVSKTDIAERVWDITFDTGTNVIEVYINYLRNKIDRDFQNKLIHTVHGMGYILKEK